MSEVERLYNIPPEAYWLITILGKVSPELRLEYLQWAYSCKIGVLREEYRESYCDIGALEPVFEHYGFGPSEGE